MNKLKKIFYVLVVAGLLDLAAVPAMAQFTRAAALGTVGPAFTTSSLPRQMRVPGLAETAGEVVLTSISPGAVFPDASSIDFLFNTSIGNGVNTTVWTGNVRCNGAICPAGITAAQVGTNIIRVSFVNPADANVGFNITNNSTLSLFGVRVNANSVGVGVNVTATMSGVSAAPATNPITFTEPQKIVGVPQVPLTVAFSASQNILSCNVNTTNVGPRVTENYPAALTSGPPVITVPPLPPAPFFGNDEQNFSNSPTPATNGSDLYVTLSGVPAGLTVTPASPIINGTLTLTIVNGAAVASTGADITFVYTVTADTTGAVENTGALVSPPGPAQPFNFAITATTGNTIAVQNSVKTITMTVGYRPESTTATVIPRFVVGNISGGPTAVATVSDCVTRLLYSWGVNIAGYETGIAISNTSEDDLAYGTTASATAQSGSCVLTGYPSADPDGDPTTSPTVGTPVQFTTGTINSGSTEAFVISGLPGFAGFRGYILAVCNFLNAHSFAFITDGFGSAGGPTLAQGYQALVVFNGSRVLAGGESIGH